MASQHHEEPMDEQAEVIEELILILQDDPNMSSIEISGRQIYDFGGIYEVLREYPYLQELNVCDNLFRELPADLSGLSKLANLNLNGNQFADFNQTVIALKTIPQLKSVYLNLYQEDQVDFIMRTLDKLDFLNGLRVERDILDDDEDDESSYQDSQGTSTQPDLAVQPQLPPHNPYHRQSTKGKNPATQIYTIHSESHQEEEEDEYQDSVQNRNPLVTSADDETQRQLNNHAVHHDSHPATIYSEQDAQSEVGDELDVQSDCMSRLEDLDPQDLEAIALIYQNIRTLRRNNTKKTRGKDYNTTDKQLAAEFDQHLHQVMGQLSQDVESEETTPGTQGLGLGKGAFIIKAKAKLMDIHIAKMGEYLKAADCHESQEVLQNISQQYQMFVSQAIELSQLKVQHWIKKAERADTKYQVMKARKDQEIQSLRHRIKQLEGGHARLDGSPSQQNGPTQHPQLSENHFQTSILLPKTKQILNVSTAVPNHHKKKSVAPLGLTTSRNLTLKQLKDVINDIYTSKIKFDKKCEALKQPRETMEQYMYTYLNQKYGLKNLIIEWAVSIINGIKTYLKEDHDVTLFGKILKNECDEEFRFIQSHVKDTLQSLLKALLKDKYPLKSEVDTTKMYDGVISGQIDEWIWRKIIEKMYDPRDYEILEARFTQMIDDKKTWKVRTNQHDQSRSSVLGNSYSGAASGPMMNTAQKKLSREEMIHRVALNANMIQEKLTYAEFQKTILDFQLTEHEKFLHEFTQIFKQMDGDRNGILNEDEFRELLIQMRVLNKEEDLIVLLQIVDPYNNQKMTYSEVVHLLSSHMIPAGGDGDLSGNPGDSLSTTQPHLFNQQISVLEKFVNMRTGGAYFDGRPSASSLPGMNTKQNYGVAGGGQEDIRMMIMNMREEDQNLDDHQQQQPRRQHPPQINTDLDDTYEAAGTITSDYQHN